MEVQTQTVVPRKSSTLASFLCAQRAGDDPDDFVHLNPACKVRDEPFWSYSPCLLQDSRLLFERLMIEVAPLVGAYSSPLRDGTIVEARRRSCKFSALAEHQQLKQSTEGTLQPPGYDKGYYSVPLHDWSKSPFITAIRQRLEQHFGVSFDYCLLHVYRNGRDNIGYHVDREAMRTPIASVSLGASRKFRFRPIGATTGYSNEYQLQSGDVIFMKSGCQKAYQHTVPPELRVQDARINLTFRQFEV